MTEIDPDAIEEARQRADSDYDERAEEIQEEVDRVTERVNRALDEDDDDNNEHTTASATDEHEGDGTDDRGQSDPDGDS